MFSNFLCSLKSILRFIYSVIVTFPRDITGIFYLITVEAKLRKWERKGETAFKIFRQLVKKHPYKPCFISDSLTLTFKEVEEYSNKIARLFDERFQLQKGDVVALFMENRPEYATIWLGLSKLGVITALINSNLKSKALVHSINVSNAKCIIYSAELFESVDQVKNELDSKLQYIPLGSKSKNDNLKLEALLSNISDEPYFANYPILSSDIMLYIYTSGTTGLPKPAIIKHHRFLAAGYTFFTVARFTSDEVVYCTLPIYHANGGLIGIGMAFVSGATVVLRKKFSASNFWKDCIEYKCTAIVYVGELLRYLVNQPESHLDKKHSVRIALGNGLRSNVWNEFVKRFGVKPIEFYAASEGNCTLINIGSQIGACGFVPVLNRIVGALKLYIIKTDDDLNPIRNKNGACIPCKINEKGLLIGMIGDTVKTAYSGYANNKSASEKKIIYDVFKKGQNAFNSGDSMMMDELGYIYFCDRLGDTYRWKGENISTVEVENIMSEKIKSTEVIVYGVEVPGQEGKAGMATIVDHTFDIKSLNDLIKNDLTSYARPIFVRLVKDVEHTGTFKAKKTTLVEEGYNINEIKDKLFYFDAKQQNYLLLTKQIYEEIQNQKLKF